jgi:deazaflavin-dependent oxidoreductase (nitroreductase family)
MKNRFYRLIKKPPQLAYALGLGPLIGHRVLLLTTIGRKTGLPRTTPLQYEKIDGQYFVGSAKGVKADWYRNLVANPQVKVRVKGEKFTGTAETTTDPARIADFLEYRLRHHPRMVGAMLKANGFPSNPTRKQLVEYAANRAMVIIKPVDIL